MREAEERERLGPPGAALPTEFGSQLELCEWQTPCFLRQMLRHFSDYVGDEACAECSTRRPGHLEGPSCFQSDGRRGDGKVLDTATEIAANFQAFSTAMVR